jgi:DNA-K related protein
VLEQTWTDRDPRLWAAIGRLGARIPAYASVDRVVSSITVERWLDHLLREKWAEVPTAAEAAARMARFTEDRARDLPERVRQEVARRLTALPSHPDWARAVTERVEVAERDRLAFYGEEMPVGLRLV